MLFLLQCSVLTLVNWDCQRGQYLMPFLVANNTLPTSPQWTKIHLRCLWNVKLHGIFTAFLWYLRPILLLCDQWCSQRKAAERYGTAGAVCPAAAERDGTAYLCLVGSKAMNRHGCRVVRNKQLPTASGQQARAGDCCQAVSSLAAKGQSVALTHSSLPSMAKTPGFT